MGLFTKLLIWLNFFCQISLSGFEFFKKKQISSTFGPASTCTQEKNFTWIIKKQNKTLLRISQTCWRPAYGFVIFPMCAPIKIPNDVEDVLAKLLSWLTFPHEIGFFRNIMIDFANKCCRALVMVILELPLFSHPNNHAKNSLEK